MISALLYVSGDKLEDSERQTAVAGLIHMRNTFWRYSDFLGFKWLPWTQRDTDF